MDTRVCECCDREQTSGETWIVGSEGEDFCPECAADLAAALQEQIAKLPRRIGLCPEHASEFYYPLGDGEGITCPQCSLELVAYERATASPPGPTRQEAGSLQESGGWTPQPSVLPERFTATSGPRHV